MSSILEIFFPLCAADPIHWQRRTPDVEHGIWSDVANEQLQQWLQTDAIRLYIPGEWISVWQVELPVVARKQIAERGENIQVWIDPVVFNDLLNWLNALDEKYALRVTQIDASAAEKTGMVNVQRLEFGRG